MHWIDWSRNIVTASTITFTYRDFFAKKQREGQRSEILREFE